MCFYLPINTFTLSYFLNWQSSKIHMKTGRKKNQPVRHGHDVYDNSWETHVFTLASEVMVTSRILNIHSLSSSWLLAATSSTGPDRMEVFGTREKTYGLLPFPSRRATGNQQSKRLYAGKEMDRIRNRLLLSWLNSVSQQVTFEKSQYVKLCSNYNHEPNNKRNTKSSRCLQKSEEGSFYYFLVDYWKRLEG